MSRFKRLFSLTPSSVKLASAILAISAIASNVLGLLRNIIFLRLVSPEDLDIYYASFRVADFIFNIFILSTIQTALVPIVSEILGHGKDREAHKVTNQLISWITVLIIIFGGIASVFMEPIMKVVVSGFNPTALEQTVFLSRVLLVQSLVFGWSYCFSGLLNGYHRFSTYAMAPLVYNLTLIAGGMLAPRFGVNGMVYAVVIGAMLHGLIQYYEVQRTGYRFHFTLKYDTRLKELLTLMWPRSITQGISQLVLVVYTKLASGLRKGSLTVFSNVNDLQTTPAMIVGNSVSMAAFPTFSKHIAKQEWDEVSRLLNKLITISLYLLIPSIAMSFILRAQVMRLYIGIGSADWELTQIAIRTFVWFLVGMIPAALVSLLSRIYLAMKNSVVTMWVQVASGTVSIAVAAYTIRSLGWDVAGLAAATSAMSVSQVVLYVFLLQRHAHIDFAAKEFASLTWKYAVGSLLLVLASRYTLIAVDALYKSTGFMSTHSIRGLLLQTVIAALVGMGVYLGYSKRVCKNELNWILNRKISTL